MREAGGMGEVSAEADPVRQLVSALPKPLVRQGVLLLPILLDLVVLVGFGDALAVGPFYFAGLGLLLGATVLAARPARFPLPALGTLVLIIDLAAIGLMRLVPDGNGLGLLVVLPAMWLAADHRMRGVGITLLASAALVSLPTLVYFGMEAAWLSRALLIPALACACSITVAGTGQVWANQNRQLEEQGRALESALEEATASRALNEAIVSTVDVGLVSIDRDGHYRSMNPRHEEFMRLAFPDGHAGRAGQLGAVFAADRVTRLTRADMPSVRAAQGEEFVDYVIWVGEEPAGQRALSVSAGSVVDPQGEFDGAVLVYKDVTDLMSALRVKDDFVASVSHELRTPLTSMMGFLDLVLDDPEAVTPEVRQQLDVVKRNSERLLRLVGDLLLTAQIDMGHVSLDLVMTDLSVLVGQSLSDLAPQAEDSEIALRSELPAALTVRVDPSRIRQLVDNLVSNAIKYTPPGGSVTVRLEKLPGEVQLTVADTGIGISLADQSQLFTRFFRTQDAATRAIQGLGLGLAITKSIVEAHGGTIDVESAAGRGSIFRVRLPQFNEPAPSDPSSLRSQV